MRTALLVIDPKRATNNEVRIGHWLKIDHQEQGVTSEHATHEVEEGKMNPDRDKNRAAEATVQLEQLARKVVKLHDRAVLQSSFCLPGGNPRLYRRWQRYRELQQNPETGSLKLAQMAIETALHDALFCLHEEREFRIQALTRDGEWINITEYSDGIHGDLFDWLERYSEYGCVTNEFIKVK